MNPIIIESNPLVNCIKVKLSIAKKEIVSIAIRNIRKIVSSFSGKLIFGKLWKPKSNDKILNLWKNSVCETFY